MSETHAPLGVPGSRRNLSRRIRCPNGACKAAHLHFSEHHPGLVERFVQQDDYSISCIGKEDDVTGEHYVMAHCQVCSNAWRVRGLTRVRDLHYSVVDDAP